MDAGADGHRPVHARACLHADGTLSGEKVAVALGKVVALRSAPQSIMVDNGTEFTSKALDLWACRNGVHLDLIRPGKPVETAISRASTASCGTNA